MKTSHLNKPRSRHLHNTQQGVTLLLALIMLIAMTLAGLALFRQVGSGVIIARNLTFRQAALAASDQGVEAARKWLTDPAQAGSALDQGSVAGAYFPAWCNVSLNGANIPDVNNDGAADNCAGTATQLPPQPSFEPSTYNWINSVQLTAPDGSEVDYVIHRMCSLPGDINASNQQCATFSIATSGPDKGDVGSYQKPITGEVRPYYRVTTRVVGPMNTIVYTQSMIY